MVGSQQYIQYTRNTKSSIVCASCFVTRVADLSQPSGQNNGVRDSTVDRKRLILRYIDFSWSFGVLSDRQRDLSVLPKLSY